MILNIHGYNSSGKNSKYKFLTEEYKNDLIISPTFDYKNDNPYNILDSLKNAVTSNFEKGKYKKCSRCGKIKLAHNKYFSKNKTSKDGFYSICKSCRNSKAKKS